jgi:BMFP domain-containing protein YqiC
MRGWSIEAAILEKQIVDWPTAQKLSAQYWDDALAARMQKRGLRGVLVATASQLKAVAAVPYGADRGALTRVARDGNVCAAELVARLDFDSATETLAEMRLELSETSERITRLEKDIQALRGEGASAAARGDSEAVLAEVRDLLKMAGG